MFVFKEDTFQRNPSNPCPDNEFNSDVIDFIKEIRKFYPELEHWSNTGVLFAWEGYLQDVYAVGWTELVRRERTAFSHTATYRSYDHALILVEQGHTTLKFGILESKSRGKTTIAKTTRLARIIEHEALLF